MLNLKGRLKMMIKKALASIVLAISLTSCIDQPQVVYEGVGFVVYEKKLGNKPERGKYIYKTRDQSGKVTIWSNGEFDINDTLTLSLKGR